MKIDVRHTAKLANLSLSKTETEVFAKQLDETLKYIDGLKEIDTSKTEGTNEVNNLNNVWRDDEVKPSLPQKSALMNAKLTHNGFFIVPAILEETDE